MKLNATEQELFDRLQADFPLTPRPYAALAAGLGTGEAEVIARIKQFKEEGIIRQIGPVLDAARLGYRTTLVAARIAPAQMEEAADILRRHPGISHGYERDHPFNLWFTLAAPGRDGVAAALAELEARLPAGDIFAMPATRLFKLRAVFTSGEHANGGAETAGHNGQRAARLSGEDRRVINGLQQDLPPQPQPFAGMAGRAGLAEEDFLARCRSLGKRGVIRRFGAAVNHRRAGFAANAMTCWAAPPEQVEMLGEKLSARREVSHCYERQTNRLWRHNVFAMIHGRSRQACQEIIDGVVEETGLSDYIVLLSTRELKKTRIKYTV